MIQSLSRHKNSLRLLRQTKLPLEVVYDDLADYHDVITAIKCLDVRGAPAIGIAAAYALALAVEANPSGDCEYLRRVASDIKAARPTAVNLAWAIDRVMNKLEEIAESGGEVLAAAWAEAEAIHDEDRRLCQQIGLNGAELIGPTESMLTHCHAGALATGGIGTALAVIHTCQQQGKRPKIYADETRPLLQGARLTCWELQQEGIDVTLICDSVAAVLMRQGRIDHVIVGADRIAANGDVANKIGTYGVAVQAREHGVPFYVAAPYSTFDQHTPTGADIPIEERDPSEVTEGFGRQTAPDGITVFAPAFDITPVALVSKFITDKGVSSGGRS
jgi:methylthioribose-1-phosphate isomerase